MTEIETDKTSLKLYPQIVQGLLIECSNTCVCVCVCVRARTCMYVQKESLRNTVIKEHMTGCGCLEEYISTDVNMLSMQQFGLVQVSFQIFTQFSASSEAPI